MDLFKRIEKLPNNNQYVLARFQESPWGDDDAKNNEHEWVVVKFIKGITEIERDKLSDDDDRKKTYHSADEWINNREGYYWDKSGPGSFFGQECDYWCELPEI